ncbi:MAG: hypothetical protein WC829_21340, partial [Hyphomicrobium sp.]
ACATWMVWKKLATTATGMNSGSRLDGAGAKLRPIARSLLLISDFCPPMNTPLFSIPSVLTEFRFHCTAFGVGEGWLPLDGAERDRNSR